ncbi:glycosyltransferase family 2 protein [Roseburia inulinivorans]
MKKIEMVVPCYNEELCIEPLYEEINRVMQKLTNYEAAVLFVDDGSHDKTMEKIKGLTQKKTEIRYLSFSRNFGKEAAIFAGLANSTGDIVVLMDADLQHPPALIPQMIKEVEAGADCCGARRIDRKGEPLIRSFFSKAFYRFMKKTTGLDFVQGGSDFRAMTRQVVQAVVAMPEKERFTKGILSWVGFQMKWLEYENVERTLGTTKWSFWGLVRYGVNGFLAFSTTPLRAAVYLGFMIDIAAVIYALVTFFSMITTDAPRTGYASIILIMLFLGGTIILILGIIGEYIARLYYEVKNRPVYIVKDKNF